MKMLFIDKIILLPALLFTIALSPLGYTWWFIHKGFMVGFRAGEDQTNRMYWGTRHWGKSNGDNDD